MELQDNAVTTLRQQIDNIHEQEQLLERHKSPKLTQEEIRNLNRL